MREKRKMIFVPLNARPIDVGQDDDVAAVLDEHERRQGPRRPNPLQRSTRKEER